MKLPRGTTVSQLAGVGDTPEAALDALWDETTAALGETPWTWAAQLDVAPVRSDRPDDIGTIIAWVATGTALVTGDV